MRYAAIVEEGEDSLGTHVPDLPGFIVVGNTREELLELIQEAIEFHFEGLREAGQPIPHPSSSMNMSTFGPHNKRLQLTRCHDVSYVR